MQEPDHECRDRYEIRPDQLAGRPDAATVFSALPTFTAVMLLLGLFGSGMPVDNPASFVVLTALGYAVIVAAFGAKHKLFRNSYEPLFFDSSLSVRDKLRYWLEKPRTARQVVTNMLMLSVLAIAFVSMT